MTDHERRVDEEYLGHPVDGDDPRVKAVSEAHVRAVAAQIGVAVSDDQVILIAMEQPAQWDTIKFLAMYDAAQRFPFPKASSKDSK